MREPKEHSGKSTMGYMAISLATLFGGLFLCYLLWNVRPVPGQTLTLCWQRMVLEAGLSEGDLLFVAAQTGFIDGPRVMANMAIDSWLP